MATTITTTLTRDEWAAVLKARTQEAICDVHNHHDVDLDRKHGELEVSIADDADDDLYAFQAMIAAAKTLLDEAMRIGEPETDKDEELRNLRFIVRMHSHLPNEMTTADAYAKAFRYLLRGMQPGEIR